MYHEKGYRLVRSATMHAQSSRGSVLEIYCQIEVQCQAHLADLIEHRFHNQTCT